MLPFDLIKNTKEILGLPAKTPLFGASRAVGEFHFDSINPIQPAFELRPTASVTSLSRRKPFHEKSKGDTRSTLPATRGRSVM